MDRRSPAVVPALGILAAALLVPRLASLPVGALFALLALALAAARGRGAFFLAALALGLLSSALRPPGLGPAVDPGRPAEVAGRVTSHPVRRDDETFFRLRTASLRQGRRVTVAAGDVWVTLPADAEAPGLGAAVRLRGYLRRSPGFANGLPAARSPAWRMRLKSALFLAVEQPPSALARLGAGLRRRIEEILERAEPGARSPPLVRALVLGDRTRLPESWQQAIRRSGLAHLLAVSGLHVSLVALLLLLVAALLPARPRWLVAAAGIAAYLLVVGPRPSVLRASAMGLLGAAALLFERPPQAKNALACGVSLLLVWEPAMAADLGFRLSVAATAGILLLAPALADRWRRLGAPAALRRPLAASFAAQVATMPLVLPLAGGLHPLAAVLNLVAIPWLAVFLLAAFLWLAVAAASGAAAGFLLPCLDVLAAPVAGLAAQAPSSWVFRPLAAVAAPWLLPAALLWAALRPALAARGAVVLALLLATGSPRAGAPGGGPVELALIDVGQGEAILLRDGSRAVLVDGGGWRTGDLGGRVLVPVLAAAAIHRLDALVSTHPDVDHCGGLVGVARYLPVAELWMGPGWSGHPCAAALLATPGKRWMPLWQGGRRSVGRWRLTVLHPPRSAPQRPAGPSGDRRGRNDRSLVLSAEVFGRRVLLTGDIGAGAEKRLLAARGPGLRADVLKVAHHGSRTSTTASFLAAVAPRLALISAGPDNPYGHPAPAVLERLAGAGVLVLRTDLLGMVRLRFHPGGRIAIELPGSPRPR